MRTTPGRTITAVLFLLWCSFLSSSSVSGRDCPTCPEGAGAGSPVTLPGDDQFWPDAPTPRPLSWSESSVEPAARPTPPEVKPPTRPELPAAIICEGDRLRYREGGNLIIAEGNVRIGYKTVLLTADRAMVYVDRKEAYAEGNAVLTQGDNVIRGDKIRFDFVTEEGLLSPGSGFYEPWHGRADVLETEGREKVTFYGGVASTCDADKPHYYLKARRLVVYPDDKLVAHNVTFYAGKLPLFWLPYFRRSLKDDCRGTFLYPGYRKKWGWFFLSGYHWCLPGLNTTFHLDYRERRGLAYGFDGKFYPGREGRGEWQTYYLRDRRYETPSGEIEETERYLLEFTYRQPLPYRIGGILALSHSSDSTIRYDYFRREYRADSQPRSYLYLDRKWEDVILSLEVQPRLNDFYLTSEKLPEVKLQVQESQLGDSDFYYQGQNSYSVLTRMFPGESSARYRSDRFDTFHQLSYSRKLLGWLNVLPSTSLRYDYYSRGPARAGALASAPAGGAGGQGPEPVPDNGEEPAPPTPPPPPPPEPEEERDIWRRVFSAGLELSTDIYGVFPTQVDWLEIDRLRHVITPSVTYVFTDNPTVPPEDIYQFDAIDRIRRANFYRLSLRNQLQTKRGGRLRKIGGVVEPGGEGEESALGENGLSEGNLVEEAKTSWTLFDLTLSTPLYARPERDNNDRLIGDLSGRLRVTPYHWLGLNLDLLYDTYDNRIRRDTLDFWIRPEDDWWLTFSHNYRDQPRRDQLSAEFYLRINPVWAFKVFGRYDTVEGEFEESAFTIYRDLHCWSMSLEFRNRPDESDYSVMLAFWIKEFSQAPLRMSN